MFLPKPEKDKQMDFRDLMHFSYFFPHFHRVRMKFLLCAISFKFKPKSKVFAYTCCGTLLPLEIS